MKRILFLAPQPFFEERGTPIAVRMLLETLAVPGKLEFDLITYAPGIDLQIPGVQHLRLPHLTPGKTIKPGLSLSKLFADVALLIKTLSVVFSKPHGYYTHIHAVEESVFIALLCKWFCGYKYIYDMDSSLADQVVEKIPSFGVLSGMFRWLEGVAIKNSYATIAVCESLRYRAHSAGSKWTELLSDVSLLGPIDEEINLRKELGLDDEAKIALYIGNLEHYQGVDLLLESWSRIAKENPSWHVVVIGGTEGEALDTRRRESKKLAPRIIFAGPRRVADLASYLNAADLLVSPRILGNNTPMKIYSYLHAGKAIVATDLPTHRQVLNDQTALLCTVDQFSVGLSRVMSDENFRERLATQAKSFAEQNCTLPVFQKKAREIYARALS